MNWLVQLFRTRDRRQATLPFVLAVLVVALGALLYLELVMALLEYVG